MMTKLRAAGVFALAATMFVQPVLAQSYGDDLTTPARMSPLTIRNPLNALVLAGSRLVAAGQRGHIVYSDDDGKTWVQAKVPVRSDLTALAFPKPTLGWAVGHDGVVLHSQDGGASWVKQLDGNQAARTMADYYAAEAAKGNAAAEQVMPEMERVVAEGADKPFLDVWFANEKDGFIVGAFNMIFRTADGGKSWQPWFERTENPNRLHLYAIRGNASEVFIVGERGLILRMPVGGERFAAVASDYAGSYFGVLPTSEALFVFGMRGHVFRSTNLGASWKQLPTGIGGGMNGGVSLGANRLVLVSAASDVLYSTNNGDSFDRLKPSRPMSLNAVAPGTAADTVVLVGARGVATAQLNTK
jgi:photosystem II stability/assembly factor-like uncharacterized protein